MCRESGNVRGHTIGDGVSTMEHVPAVPTSATFNPEPVVVDPTAVTLMEISSSIAKGRAAEFSPSSALLFTPVVFAPAAIVTASVMTVPFRETVKDTPDPEDAVPSEARTSTKVNA